MIRVSIETIGKKPSVFIANLEKKWFEFQNEVIETGEKAEEVMKGRIEQKRKRPKKAHPSSPGDSSKSLIDAITLEQHIGTGFDIGWGLGKIAKLESEAPHFRAINYGLVDKFVGRVVWGHWNNRLIQSQPPLEPIKITNPIKPINYIEGTSSWLKSQIRKILKKFKG